MKSTPAGSIGMTFAARRYLIGFFLTNIGVGGFVLATGLILFSATGSAATFGALVGLEFGLGVLGQIVGASVLDRYNTLKIALVSNTIRGCAIVVCGAVLLLQMSAAPLIIVFLISAIIRPLYRAASFALVPSVCDKEDLPRINGLRFGLLQVAQMIGLLWVSLLNVVAPQPVMLFGVAAFLLIGTHVMAGLRHFTSSTGAVVRQDPLGVGEHWRELFTGLRHTPVVFVHLFLGCAGPVAVALAAVLVAPVNAELGGGALGIVILQGSAALGSFGAVLVARRFEIIRLPRLIWFAQPLMAAGLLLLGPGPQIGLAVIAFFTLGCGAVLSATVLGSLLHYRTAPGLIGRIAIVQETTVSVFALITLPLFGQLIGTGIGSASVIYAIGVASFTLVFAVAWVIRRDEVLISTVGQTHR